VFLPYSFDVLYDRRPWMAYILVPLFVIFMFTGLHPFAYESLDGFEFGLLSFAPCVELVYLGVLGFYLWVFSSALCSKIGNAMFLVLISGFVVTILIISTHERPPFLLAGFLLEGILGICLSLWPTNSVDCFLLIPLRFTFSVPIGWIVLGWFAFDMLWALLFGWNLALIMLPLCLLGGVLLGGFFLVIRVAVMDPDDRTLWQILRRAPEPDHTWEDSWTARKNQTDDTQTGPDLPLPVPKLSPEAADEHRILCECGHPVTVPKTRVEKPPRCPYCGCPLRSV
jgi:hypothetical protein